MDNHKFFMDWLKRHGWLRKNIPAAEALGLAPGTIYKLKTQKNAIAKHYIMACKWYDYETGKSKSDKLLKEAINRLKRKLEKK